MADSRRADPASTRARGLLLALRAAVPFDGAWLALTDEYGTRYDTLAGVDLPEGVADSCAGHECLLAAGFDDALSVTLVTRGGRRVGLLVVLYRTGSRPSWATRHRLAELAPELATAIDPMPSLLAATRLVPGVTAGTAVLEDGSTAALSGLAGDDLLATGSPILGHARRLWREGVTYSSFLWPLGRWSAPSGHVRVSLVAAPSDVPRLLVGVALLSPVDDLKGLTPRELEVVGLLLDGYSNSQIARRLTVTPRTVATHIEHVFPKLRASSRTSVAVRAQREGLYVPRRSRRRADRRVEPAASGSGVPALSTVRTESPGPRA